MPVVRVFRRYLTVIADYDQDEVDDLLVMVHDTGGITSAADTASLTGALRDGTAFTGSDDLCRFGPHR